MNRTIHHPLRTTHHCSGRSHRHGRRPWYTRGRGRKLLFSNYQQLPHALLAADRRPGRRMHYQRIEG